MFAALRTSLANAVLEIFSDADCTTRLNTDILWEGATYYLDLGDLSEVERLRLIDKARLTPFAQFNRHNRICPFKVDGFVGTIAVGGRTLDVRSRKLQLDQSGDRQFRTMLAEIDEVCAGLIFRYEAPTRREAAERTTAHQPSTLERLDYFVAIFGEHKVADPLPTVIRRILSNPHHVMRTARQVSPIQTARRVDVVSYVKSIGRAELARLAPLSAAATSPAVARAVDGEAFLPRHVPTRRPYVSHDTSENRFLKFFLQDVEGTCLEVLRDRGAPALALTDARWLLAEARGLLASPFFAAIGKLQHLPSCSPVLVGNEAYNRIYESYLDSRLGTADPLDSARRQLRSSPLKDVATLYEVWAFFQIAQAFFGKGSEVVVSGRAQYGLPYGTTWQSDGTSVAYNRSFSPPGGSYSLTLRPDVTVQIGDQLWLFDAKYKSDRSANIDETDQASISAAVKKIDVHKMHTYVDAIAHSRAALAVYPGTEVTLFPKVAASGDRMNDLCRHGGVGGIPLVPSRRSDELLAVVMSVKAASQ